MLYGAILKTIKMKLKKTKKRTTKTKKKAKKKKRRISTTHKKITENHHRFVLTPSAKARRGKWSSIGETEERERERDYT